MPIIKQWIFANIHSLDDIYKSLDIAFTFPEHMSYNLDALSDFLTTDAKGPLQIVWHKEAAKESGINADILERFINVFTHAANERKDLVLILSN